MNSRGMEQCDWLEMRFLSKIYTIAKTPLMENFKHGWKNDMVAKMETLFVKRVHHM